MQSRKQHPLFYTMIFIEGQIINNLNKDHPNTKVKVTLPSRSLRLSVSAELRGKILLIAKVKILAPNLANTLEVITNWLTHQIGRRTRPQFKDSFVCGRKKLRFFSHPTSHVAIKIAACIVSVIIQNLYKNGKYRPGSSSSIGFIFPFYFGKKRDKIETQLNTISPLVII